MVSWLTVSPIARSNGLDDSTCDGRQGNGLSIVFVALGFGTREKGNIDQN